MHKSINQLLAKVARTSIDDQIDQLAFPFSRRIDGTWYDIASDGHRLLAVEAVEPHYALALGPNVDQFLTPQTTRFGFDGTGLEELVAVAKACPKYKRNSRELRLRHGDGIEAVVNPDLLLDLLAACGKDAIVVSVKGALDPVRIDGIRETSIGDHYQRVLGVVMPIRGVQDELPGLSQFRLTYDLPAQMYGEVRLHEKPKDKAEKGEAA